MYFGSVTEKSSDLSDPLVTMGGLQLGPRAYSWYHSISPSQHPLNPSFLLESGLLISIENKRDGEREGGKEEGKEMRKRKKER